MPIKKNPRDYEITQNFGSGLRDQRIIFETLSTGHSEFQKLSLPNEIKSTSFQVKISLNSTTTSKNLL